MRLTRFSDYSLRVLMYLAVRTGGVATIDEIAEAYGISRAHLTKVVRELGRTGLLKTTRGRGGGVRLASPPEEVAVGEVLRLTEPDLALVECLDAAGGDCRIDPVCGLRGALQEALAAFLETLDGYTLADLVARRRRPLLQLLEAPR